MNSGHVYSMMTYLLDLACRHSQQGPGDRWWLVGLSNVTGPSCVKPAREKGGPQWAT